MPFSVWRYISIIPSWKLTTLLGQYCPPGLRLASRELVSPLPSVYSVSTLPSALIGLPHLSETAEGKFPSGTSVVKSSVKTCFQPGISPVGISSPEGAVEAFDLLI